jgi:hypothetical protein
MRVGLLVILCTALFTLACPAQVTFASQSVNSMTVTAGNSISCNTGATPPQYHVANSYIRKYDMMAAGVLLPSEICSIRYGVEFALAGLTATSQPAQIRLYVVPTAGFAFPVSLATLNLVHTENFTVANVAATATNTILTQTITANPPVVVLPTDSVVVEFFTPDGVALQNVLFFGSNNLGETAPTFLVAPGCGVTVPTPTGTLAAGLMMHGILDIGYRTASAPLTLTLSSPMAGDLKVDLDGLIPGHEYYTVYSFQPCPVLGTGPYLGICESNINNLIAQLMLPPVIYPLHFVGQSCSQTQTFPGIPPNVYLEAVSFDFTGGTLVQQSLVANVTIQ